MRSRIASTREKECHSCEDRHNLGLGGSKRGDPEFAILRTSVVGHNYKGNHDQVAKVRTEDCFWTILLAQ